MIGKKELEQYDCVKALADYSHIRDRLEEFNSSPARHTLLTCENEVYIQKTPISDKKANLGLDERGFDW